MFRDEISCVVYGKGRTDDPVGKVRWVRFRDGLWTEVVAGKGVDQLTKWARDWTEKQEGEDSD